MQKVGSDLRDSSLLPLLLFARLSVCYFCFFSEIPELVWGQEDLLQAFGVCCQHVVLPLCFTGDELRSWVSNLEIAAAVGMAVEKLQWNTFLEVHCPSPSTCTSKGPAE